MQAQKTKHIPLPGTGGRAVDHPRLLVKDCQRQLRTDTARMFIEKLLLLIVLTGIFASGIVLSRQPFRLMFQICLGVVFAHATELVHQCLHKTATGNATWDSVLGRVLGWPSVTSFWHYRWFHLWHHKHNGTERDHESFTYTYELMRAPRRLTRVLGFVRHLSMSGHYWSTLRRLQLAVKGQLSHDLTSSTPELNYNIARRIQRDYVVMAGLLSILAALSVLLHTFIVVEVWLLPLLIAWGPAHALIELPEHWGCDRPNENVFENTRSINGGRFARWYTNNNCNHVGHHYGMSLPMESLPEFERRLMEENHFKYYEASYSRFYLRFLTSLYVGGARGSQNGNRSDAQSLR